MDDVLELDQQLFDVAKEVGTAANRTAKLARKLADLNSQLLTQHRLRQEVLALEDPQCRLEVRA